MDYVFEHINERDFSLRIKHFGKMPNKTSGKPIIKHHKYQYYSIYIQNRYLCGYILHSREFIMRIWAMTSGFEHRKTCIYSKKRQRI